ncbi:heme lyase CcmF/NrfE family subunit [Undibacterium pigrum]|uniref:Cytochrome c-type biogenesis protein CcmF n=1 Tax=Undibacterium pigrum TaxID=401470 RepID=A0A318JB43_9BURK|nr:heme lyase CcmF/NrfE family subunit [Undibacterium pigrum]PXX44067.1 cytochrome c-type biogenesis protein CcmF [Undibacterium pigrum]
MIIEFGHFALILALVFSVLQATIPSLGIARKQPAWTALARPLAVSQFLLILLSFAILITGFVADDFSVAYVAAHSNTRLPVFYKIAGSWGGHEGSLLLWVLILAGWGLAVAWRARALTEIFLARVMAIMGALSFGFLSFILFTSNPFTRSFPAVAEGRDLNPLLQDPGMIIHPPLLYMGYVGFSVAFAFALAALIDGKVERDWARQLRPWTLAAWTFLTLGIFMGSFWAYYELGWGGWWFWDAVENASFMPWLVGTALLHTLIVNEKRDGFKSWTILLAILAFSLSLLGTFLVRSGVLTSVHAFASDPKRGVFILIFLALVSGGALGLYAWRAPQIRSSAAFTAVSKETTLLLNNVLLLVVAATVLLGTLYPLFLDALQLGKISVGPPYFEATFVPLILPVLFLMALAPYLAWKQAKLKNLDRFLLIALLLALSVVAFLTYRYSFMFGLGAGLGVWILLATAGQLRKRVYRPGTEPNAWGSLHAPSLGFWGMLIAHAGVAIFTIGVSAVKSLETSEDYHLRPGDQMQLAGYQVVFKSLEKIDGPNYIAARGEFIVSEAETTLHLQPERRIYTAQNMPMTEAAINRGWLRDVYISLGEASKDHGWMVRVQIKPFMSWIWAGCLAIALGGLLAALERRYKPGTVKASQHNPVLAETFQTAEPA